MSQTIRVVAGAVPRRDSGRSQVSIERSAGRPQTLWSPVRIAATGDPCRGRPSGGPGWRSLGGEHARPPAPQRPLTWTASSRSAAGSPAARRPSSWGRCCAPPAPACSAGSSASPPAAPSCISAAAFLRAGRRRGSARPPTCRREEGRGLYGRAPCAGCPPGGALGRAGRRGPRRLPSLNPTRGPHTRTQATGRAVIPPGSPGAVLGDTCCPSVIRKSATSFQRSPRLATPATWPALQALEHPALVCAPGCPPLTGQLCLDRPGWP